MNEIFIKSSYLESFSYPSLEVTESGGYSLVVSYGGNKEYLKDRVNCLLYKLGDLDYTVKNKERLISDGRL